MIQSFKLAIILFALLITSCKQTTTESTQQSEKQTAPVHPRVVWTENPQEHAIISWTTLADSRQNTVYYDTVEREGNRDAYAFSTHTVRDGKVTMNAMDWEEGVPEGWYHHAELTRLNPGTTYFFVLESDGALSDEFHFISAPEEAERIKLLTGGDSRLGGEKPRYAGRKPHTERQAMKKLIGTLCEEDPQIMAFVHGADYGTTADWRHLYWYFEDLQLSITDEGRLLPLIISMGNHDTELGFLENFYLGSVNHDIAFAYYYVTPLSNEVALVTLNTEIDVSGVQYEWLSTVLPELQDQYNTLLVNYHKPAFPAVKDPDSYKYTRIREHWVPLFEKYGVNLVIESDGHCLKRTPPIKNNRVDPEGIVYIGEGGLGAPLREPDTTRWFLQGGYAAKLTHVWLIDWTPRGIHVSAYNQEKEKADEAHID